MTVTQLTGLQKQLHEKIRKCAEENDLIKQKPFLAPIYDGVKDIKAYLNSTPKIMWILKEPYEDSTASGKFKGGDRLIVDGDVSELVSPFWQVIRQVNYGIRNNMSWADLPYAEDEPQMYEEINKMAFINVGKMPAATSSPDSHIAKCYDIWKDIIHEQITTYAPDVIIFGKTFHLLADFFQIDEKPVSTVAGQWNTDAYKKDNLILIDAYHPSRKGGEDASKDYVTSIIKSYQKLSK